MNNNTERIKELMQKYIDRSSTNAERDELLQLIKSSQDPSAVDGILSGTWKDIDGSEVLKDLDWQHIIEASQKEKRQKTGNVWHMIGRWSAAAAVILCIYFIMEWKGGQDEWMVYETEYGEKMDFILEDGTLVSLNANSKLSWNKNWRKSSLRQVDLEGEAFFDVSHLDRQGESLESQPIDEKREKMPFEVYTSDLTIQVLGTTFNASNRRGKTKIYLESGSVALSLKQSSIGVSSKSSSLSKKESKQTDQLLDENTSSTHQNKDVIYMEPGDFVQYTRGKSLLVEKSDLKMDNHLEWKEGTLSYRDVEFRSMLQNLEDIYGKTFLVEDENLLSTRVEFGVPYEDWETVTQMMEWMLKIDIEEIGNNQIRIKKRKGN